MSSPNLPKSVESIGELTVPVDSRVRKSTSDLTNLSNQQTTIKNSGLILFNPYTKDPTIGSRIAAMAASRQESRREQVKANPLINFAFRQRSTSKQKSFDVKPEITLTTENQPTKSFIEPSQETAAGGTKQQVLFNNRGPLVLTATEAAAQQTRAFASSKNLGGLFSRVRASAPTLEPKSLNEFSSGFTAADATKTRENSVSKKTPAPSVASRLEVSSPTALFSSLSGIAKRITSTSKGKKRDNSTSSQHSRGDLGDTQQESTGGLLSKPSSIVSKPGIAQALDKMVSRSGQGIASAFHSNNRASSAGPTMNSQLTQPSGQANTFDAGKKESSILGSFTNTLTASFGLRRSASRTQFLNNLAVKDLDNLVEKSVGSKYSAVFKKHKQSFSGETSELIKQTYYMKNLEYHLKFETASPHAKRAKQHFLETFASVKHMEGVRKPSDENIAKSKYQCAQLNNMSASAVRSKFRSDCREVHYRV